MNAIAASELVNFNIMAGEKQLRASVELPRANISVENLLPILRELSGSVIGAIAHDMEADGHTISCRKGCGACCRQLVPLSLFEADALTNWVHGLPEDQQMMLGARFEAALAILQQKSLLERLDFSNSPEAGSPEHRQLAVDYLAASVPCPFLVNESCSIHPIRPLICREYLVTSPAEYCVAPTEETVRPVPMPISFSHAIFRMGQSLTSNGQGWFPLVFLFRWIQTGIVAGRAIAMPGPEMFLTVLHELEQPGSSHARLQQLQADRAAEAVNG